MNTTCFNFLRWVQTPNPKRRIVKTTLPNLYPLNITCFVQLHSPAGVLKVMLCMLQMPIRLGWENIVFFWMSIILLFWRYGKKWFRHFSSAFRPSPLYFNPIFVLNQNNQVRRIYSLWIIIYFELSSFLQGAHKLFQIYWRQNINVQSSTLTHFFTTFRI